MIPQTARHRLVFSLVIANTVFSTPVLAQSPGSQPHFQSSNRRIQSSPQRKLEAAKDYVPDILLVSVNQNADKGEVSDAIKDLHGTVLETIGSGALTTIVLQTEKGALEETEKKLAKDTEHFGAFQRNTLASAHLDLRGAPNDPYFSAQWHLAALEVPEAWSYTIAERIPIAVLDTGVQATNVDLAGKVYKGFDTFPNSGYTTGNTDIGKTSHGTVVATAAAATTNNKKLTAAPASDAYIFPVRIANADARTSEAAILKGIEHCINNRIRICNISYGADDIKSSFANPKAHPVLHEWLKYYHDRCDGLIFMSAGNSGQYDSSPRNSYLIVVSAVAKGNKLASFSNWGTPVWFAAPGVDITVSDKNGRVANVNGTSLSAPLLAGVAAMFWAKAPNLPNTTIEKMLIASCGGRNIVGDTWNTEMGFGVPSAGWCLKNLAKYNRGVGDTETLAEDLEHKAPVYDGPVFEIEPVAPSQIAEDDTQGTKPIKKTPANKPTFGPENN